MINLNRVYESLRDKDLWMSEPSFGTNRGAYQSLLHYLQSSRGSVSFALRTNPFDGPFTSPEWLEKLAKLGCESVDVDHWLGATKSYTVVRDGQVGETKKGVNQLLWAAVNQQVFAFLNSVNCVFDWLPPKPDDFAAYSSDGELICFAIAHEEMFFVRRSHQDLWTIYATTANGLNPFGISSQLDSALKPNCTKFRDEPTFLSELTKR